MVAPIASERTYASVEECREILDGCLNLGSSLWRQATISGLADACEATAPKARGTFALRVGRWVVRDDDLKLFQGLKGALLAMAGVQFFLATPTASAVAGVVFAVAEAALSARKNGATLTPEQAAVVAVLKAGRRPLTPQEIAAALADSRSPGIRELGADEVESCLRLLGAVPTRNGLTKLVDRQDTGQWLLRGV